MSGHEPSCDVLVVGGGLGGVAAALAATRRGYRVVLTEETDWLGGQLTAQAVPPDEHPWIEQFGCTASYRLLRNAIRAYYRCLERGCVPQQVHGRPDLVEEFQRLRLRWLDGEVIRGRAGSFFLVPRGTAHTFQVVAVED